MHETGIWKKSVCVILSLMLILQPLIANAGEKKESNVVINVLDYGADPSGVNDSAVAIWKALEAAKEVSGNGEKHVTVNFPKGEYHIYKDKAQQREYHTSNTNSIENPIKTIGILIEEQKNLTIEGNGSLFMMHGNMMALAVAKSENIVLHDFSWDFAVPTVSEMTITGMGTENGRQYTDFYIPKCFPYEITGNTILWKSEVSPYTGKTYWTETGIHNAYSVVAYHPDEEMTRAYFTNEGPFQNVSSIQALDDTKVRILYNGNRPAMQKQGMVIELASSAHRETAGAFTWESKEVTANKINVHFMHGFGWLIQMSENVYYKECNLMPRENSGHITVSYADGIHASGAAGEIVIEDCNFSNTHDDPINLHGTFIRVESRIDEHTLQLKYIHTQQGGFPQYHVGDKVQFFTRDTLESTDNETEYEVSEILSNPGEEGNDLRTMIIRFKEELPENLSDRIGGQPKYVAENVTYAPKVTIRNCTFKNVPTRGILCTTRKPVLIENNTFLNMSMATIYLSNDSDEWYESGPICDMTIRGNVFYIKDIGRTSWEYASAIYIHPVTKGGTLPSADNPIHKNITIEDNTFYMDLDTVVKAESVENLVFRNNKVLRMNPDVELSIAAAKDSIAVGENIPLTVNASGSSNTGTIDNVFEFTKSKDILIEGNTYDDGLKRYAVAHDDATASNITLKDADITLVRDRSQSAAPAISNIAYASSNPEVATVEKNGTVVGKAAGTTEIFAYYKWNDTIIRSNTIQIEISGIEENEAVNIEQDNDEELQVGSQIQYTVENGIPVTWSVTDFETNQETDAASITADGKVTALKNGVVWVNASADGNTDRAALIIYGSAESALNTDITITREDNTKYVLSDEGVEIAMQAGDLYQNANNVKNLFLYDPADVKKDNLRTIIKAQGLPVKENGQWDTASFILYNDDDNYVTLGKKSHFNGISSVVEKNGAAVETNGNSADDNVTTAYLGMSKIGDTISMDYKLEGGQWQHIRDIDSSTVGDEYRIGIACWHTNNRGKKVTFSGLKVGNADLSYEELETKEPVAFLKSDNQRPIVENVNLSSVNDRIRVQYDFVDNNAEGNSLYLWNWQQEGKEITRVTAQNSIEVAGIAQISVKVYPMDSYGNPGTPSEKVSFTLEKEDTTELYEVAFNGEKVYARGDGREAEILLPEELRKVVMSYTSVNADKSDVEIYKNGTLLEGSYGNTDAVILDVEGDSEIVIKRGADEYTFKIKLAASNETAIQKIELDGLGFETEDMTDTKAFCVNADSGQGEAVLRITASKEIGQVEVQSGAYRHVLETTKTGNIFETNVKFVNGMNSFYVNSIAKDGITKEQYIVDVIYSPSTEISIDQILLNGEKIEEFQEENREYFYELAEDKEELQVNVGCDSQTSLKVSLNGDVKTGTEATFERLRDGENVLIIEGTAPDGITKKVYRITVIKAYDSNAKLREVSLNGNNVTAELVEKGGLSAFVAEDNITLDVASQDARANITVKVKGQEAARGTGSVNAGYTIYKDAQTVEIMITAADGETKETFEIVLKKGVYLSDIEWESATIGYTGDGGIKLDSGYEGNTMRLPDENGQPVAFEKGIGTHAESIITYDISNISAARFEGYVGIDYAKYNDAYGEVQFIIEIDGVQVFDSEPMQQKSAMKKFTVEIPNEAETLVLKALQGANNWSDHADWADVKLLGEFPEQPDVPIEPVESDKTLLAALIKYAEEQKANDDYKLLVPAVKAWFEGALAEAKEVNADESATQEEIDTVYDNLLSKVHLLSFIGADKTDLQTTYNALKDIDLSIYTDETAEAMRNALKIAEEVLEDENALADDIKKALEDLNTANKGLELKEKVNKEKLAGKIALAEKYVAEEEASEGNTFTEESFEALTVLLKAAKDVYADGNASQADVNTAYQLLHGAIMKLRRTPDKSYLENLMTKAEKIDLTCYSAETANAVKAAYEVAAAVVSDKEATQEEVDAAAKSLRAALDNLQKDNVRKPDNNGGQKVAAANNSKTAGGASASKTAAKTGDAANASIPAAVWFMAILTAMIVCNNCLNSKHQQKKKK